MRTVSIVLWLLWLSAGFAFFFLTLLCSAAAHLNRRRDIHWDNWILASATNFTPKGQKYRRWMIRCLVVCFVVGIVMPAVLSLFYNR